jgi:hypothetical protein
VDVQRQPPRIARAEAVCGCLVARSIAPFENVLRHRGRPRGDTDRTDGRVGLASLVQPVSIVAPGDLDPISRGAERYLHLASPAVASHFGHGLTRGTPDRLNREQGWWTWRPGVGTMSTCG